MSKYLIYVFILLLPFFSNADTVILYSGCSLTNVSIISHSDGYYIFQGHSFGNNAEKYKIPELKVKKIIQKHVSNDKFTKAVNCTTETVVPYIVKKYVKKNNSNKLLIAASIITAIIAYDYFVQSKDYSNISKSFKTLNPNGNYKNLENTGTRKKIIAISLSLASLTMLINAF